MKKGHPKIDGRIQKEKFQEFGSDDWEESESSDVGGQSKWSEAYKRELTLDSSLDSSTSSKYLDSKEAKVNEKN